MGMPNWTMPRVIGHNAKSRREELKLTAATVGEQVGQLFGKPWPRQTVYMMESGDQAMIAAEIAALAHVLQTTPANLLTPPIEAKVVSVGDLIVARDLLVGVPAHLAGASDGTLNLLRDLMDEVREAWAATGRAQAVLTDEVADRLKSIDDRITAHVSGQGKGKADG